MTDPTQPTPPTAAQEPPAPTPAGRRWARPSYTYTGSAFGLVAALVVGIVIGGGAVALGVALGNDHDDHGRFERRDFRPGGPGFDGNRERGPGFAGPGQFDRMGPDGQGRFNGNPGNAPAPSATTQPS